MGSERAHRFRKHSGAPTAHGEVRVTAEGTDTAGTVTFAPWGHAALEARPNTLVIRLQAADDEALDRMRTIIGNDLERFGRGQLTVHWQPFEAPPRRGTPAPITQPARLARPGGPVG